MSINNWWTNDSSEVFWMEITDRSDLGSALWAPQLDGAGNESWSYSLLTYVQPGDRVFHWHKTRAGEPAIVGWSEAVGPLKVEEKSWQARGTRGRARGVPTVGPAWVVPLAGFVELPAPVTRTSINHRYTEILEAMGTVAASTDGSGYLPFQNYGSRELRAQQGYLTKFPRALVDLLFPEGRRPERQPRSTRTDVRPTRRQGYLTDAAMRSAIERHSLEIAKEIYIELGATRIEERGKPFDLLVILDGIERHVEVKGSTGIDLGSVQLTQGEVLHATAWQPTDLVVVDQIVCWRDAAGQILTSGGTSRVWRNWQPEGHHLTPTHLRYELPQKGRM